VDRVDRETLVIRVMKDSFEIVMFG